MGVRLEDLRVLQDAETIADRICHHVVALEPFAREVVDGRLVRAADSIGAKIAEAFGRFHYGEKLQFLYYARGSVFDTKHWLNRALERRLMRSEQLQDYVDRLSGIARQINAFVGNPKTQQRTGAKSSPTVRESLADYPHGSDDAPAPFFTEDELEWLKTVPNL